MMDPIDIESWFFGNLVGHLLEDGGSILFCVADVSLAASFCVVAGTVNKK